MTNTQKITQKLLLLLIVFFCTVDCKKKQTPQQVQVETNTVAHKQISPAEMVQAYNMLHARLTIAKEQRNARNFNDYVTWWQQTLNQSGITFNSVIPGTLNAIDNYLDLVVSAGMLAQEISWITSPLLGIEFGIPGIALAMTIDMLYHFITNPVCMGYDIIALVTDPFYLMTIKLTQAKHQSVTLTSEQKLTLNSEEQDKILEPNQAIPIDIKQFKDRHYFVNAKLNQRDAEAVFYSTYFLFKHKETGYKSGEIMYSKLNAGCTKKEPDEEMINLQMFPFTLDFPIGTMYYVVDMINPGNALWELFIATPIEKLLNSMCVTYADLASIANTPLGGQGGHNITWGNPTLALLQAALAPFANITQVFNEESCNEVKHMLHQKMDFSFSATTARSEYAFSVPAKSVEEYRVKVIAKLQDGTEKEIVRETGSEGVELFYDLRGLNIKELYTETYGYYKNKDGKEFTYPVSMDLFQGFVRAYPTPQANKNQRFFGKGTDKNKRNRSKNLLPIIDYVTERDFESSYIFFFDKYIHQHESQIISALTEQEKMSLMQKLTMVEINGMLFHDSAYFEPSYYATVFDILLKQNAPLQQVVYQDSFGLYAGTIKLLLRDEKYLSVPFLKAIKSADPAGAGDELETIFVNAYIDHYNEQIKKGSHYLTTITSDLPGTDGYYITETVYHLDLLLDAEKVPYPSKDVLRALYREINKKEMSITELKQQILSINL